MYAGVPGTPEEGAGGGLRHVRWTRGAFWQLGRALLCKYTNHSNVTNKSMLVCLFTVLLSNGGFCNGPHHKTVFAFSRAIIIWFKTFKGYLYLAVRWLWFCKILQKLVVVFLTILLTCFQVTYAFCKEIINLLVDLITPEGKNFSIKFSWIFWTIPLEQSVFFRTILLFYSIFSCKNLIKRSRLIDMEVYLLEK